jgi:hypothetical protein
MGLFRSLSNIAGAALLGNELAKNARSGRPFGLIDVLMAQRLHHHVTDPVKERLDNVEEANIIQQHQNNRMIEMEEEKIRKREQELEARRRQLIIQQERLEAEEINHESYMMDDDDPRQIELWGKMMKKLADFGAGDNPDVMIETKPEGSTWKEFRHLWNKHTKKKSPFLEAMADEEMEVTAGSLGNIAMDANAESLERNRIKYGKRT